MSKPENDRRTNASVRRGRQRGYIEKFRSKNKEQNKLELRSVTLPVGYEGLFKAINERMNSLAMNTAGVDGVESPEDVVFRFKNTTDHAIVLGVVNVVIKRKRVELLELSGTVVRQNTSLLYRRHQMDAYLKKYGFI